MTSLSTMMLTRCRIPTLPSCFPASIALIHHARPSCPLALSRLPPLLICRCSNKTTDNAGKRPIEDTRIHWGSSEEGWVGMSDSPEVGVSPNEEGLSSWRNDRNDSLMGLLVLASDSHYRRLELTPDADTEEIKAAYRRLSKAYHPDTTALPLELAAEMFIRLKESYTVLSSEQERRFYDWQLAQKISKQQGGGFIWPLKTDKTMADNGSRLSQEWDSEKDIVQDPVDRLGGKNMDLSSQAQSAIAFDGFAIIVSILCIIYALFFKQV